MDNKTLTDAEALLLHMVPEDGKAIGNKALQEQFEIAALAHDKPVDTTQFDSIRQSLIDKGLLVNGKGRGGPVRRATAGETDFNLEVIPTQPDLTEQDKPATSKKQKTKQKAAGAPSIISYRHTDKRRNNPEVGMVNESTDPPNGKDRWCYDPHIDPALQFDFGRAQVERLIDEALESGDPDTMRAALQDLRQYSEPYLNWTGKAERTTFEVDTVSLHVHERIDPASILAAVRNRMRGEKGSPSPSGRGQGEGSYAHQPDLFAAPFENLPLRDAIDFYKHEKGWSNRLIAGDSLQVMNSLLQKEGMAGQVQMIYIDPPYGIKYGSNFQPFVNKRDVKDRKDEDLTQEPEMIKAFRDTWELGIHSYLTYLRDRLLLAKELLHESGSVFVQISDENLHHVRELMDDVFGVNSFVSQISFQKTGGIESKLLSSTVDYIVWYAKNKERTKFNRLYQFRAAGDTSLDRYDQLLSQDGSVRRLSRQEISNGITENIGCRYQLAPLYSDGASNSPQIFEFNGTKYEPRGDAHWKTAVEGLCRLANAGRVEKMGSVVRYRRLADDFPVIPISDRWESMQIGVQRSYVVQTAVSVIERCLLMTTDPGDLVLDPTCGSGTTAYVAEKWGRRWITNDTSRVAVTLAKQRLMTANFDYYALRYPQEGLKGGFIYRTVPHVTLKSIANNLEINEIYAELHPAVDEALQNLNDSLTPTPLPGGEGLKEWEVPFEFPESGKDTWPEAVRKPFDAFHAARQAMQKKMDASIAAHADQETLYDQPEIEKGKLRITGPFSVEAVPFPSVLSLEPSPQPLSQGERGTDFEADAAIARSGESARQHQWRDELLKTGIRGKGGDQLTFADLETLPGTQQLHASGHLVSDSDTPGAAGLGGERVVVSFGPEHAALEQRQVEHALNEAAELFPRPKMIVFCAFAFDPEAAKDIDQLKGIIALKAQMNTDLLTEDLKKGRSSNQSFWLMGQPDVELRTRKDGRYEVEVNGFDYFDTRSGELISGGKGRIAMWSLDTDYDERSLYPRQVFFPMAGKQDGWYKLKKNIRAELNESLLDKFHGTVSLPFAAGENHKVAVKIVDDRGIESLKIIPLMD